MYRYITYLIPEYISIPSYLIPQQAHSLLMIVRMERGALACLKQAASNHDLARVTLTFSMQNFLSHSQFFD